MLFENLLTILPVFALMAAGWLSARTGYLSSGIADHLNAFAVKLAVPFLLFRAMVGVDFGQAFNIPALGAFYLGAFASFGLAILLARKIWKRRPGEAVAVGFCALFSNTVLLGIPIVERAYGQDALTPVFGIISLHAGLMYAIGMLSMEIARADGRSMGETIRIASKSILSNPLMIGVIAGVVINLSGLKLPEVIMAPVDMLATAAIPAALVGIGAALTRYKVSAEASEALMVSALALLLHPMIAFGIAYGIFDLSQEYVRAAVVLAAMPPGMNVYIFAAMYDRAVSLSATVIILSTLLSIFTIAAWMAALQAIL